MTPDAASTAIARIRLARLDAFTEDLGSDWLTEDETARLQAMTAPLRRRSFIAGHWLARRVAADWLQADVARVSLHRHPDGRPQVLLDGEPPPVSLSLSHSGDWLACAIAAVAVGIDVEMPRRQRNLDALARFAFAPDEVERLRRTPEAGRNAEFRVLWTLKEARGKRTGEGLQPERSRRINTLPSTAGEAEAISWTLLDGALALAVDPGTAFCVEGGESLGMPHYWRYIEAG